MRALASAALLVLACPSSASADPPDVDARLRSEIVAVGTVDADVDEVDLDLDTRLDLAFTGLLRPELSGRLAFRDRRDLGAPPDGSLLRDAWDARQGRDQERFEQGWLEFGDRLAVRVGRQLDWPGAPVRYDGVSMRLRRLAIPVDAYLFAGNRASLDAIEEPWGVFDPVAGGRLEITLGQSSLQLASLYRDHHLLDVGFSRRLGRRQLFDDVVLLVGYSQLDLRPRDARAGVEIALRRAPVRIHLSADARLLRTEDEFLFDYTTSRSEEGVQDARLRLEPLPPSVLMSAHVDVHPLPALSIRLTYARRQLFSPSDTTAWSFSHHEVALGAHVLHDESGAYASMSASAWFPDLADPPQGAGDLETDGEGERRMVRVGATVGIGEGRRLGASAGLAWRRFDHVAPRATVDNLQAITLHAQVTARPVSLVSVTAWGAYDEALLVLDQGLRAAVAAGLRVELRTP